MYLGGSSVSAPHQPERSLPLKSDAKPGGGAARAGVGSKALRPRSKIRRPKAENRNKSQSRRPKAEELLVTRNWGAWLKPLLISDFRSRISDFMRLMAKQLEAVSQS